jgi:oxalate decarboxylase/phosphoglucose isomerase-like protein (cupin superfamily)
MTTNTEQSGRRQNSLPYDRWIESLGVPIHRGHFVADLRTVELDWWEERQCKTAFLQMKGMEGISEARITEIEPGATLPAMKFALGETVYVIEGSGLATVWPTEGEPRTFEWHKHSMFHLPRHAYRQLSNARGDKPARLLHYSYLPLAMSTLPDPSFFFDNPYQGTTSFAEGEDLYAEAKAYKDPTGQDIAPTGGAFWVGNFFPDMKVWDKLTPWQSRGAGGTAVHIRFPGSEMSASMSVFDAGLYKKGHMHGPGRVIVIPEGEGYSVLWPEGGEKIVCPWQEASVFTPPADWFHQHFNVGNGPARYLKFGHMSQFAGHRTNGQTEYANEQPWVREKFEAELAARGAKSLMPSEVYENANYQWEYGDGD